MTDARGYRDKGKTRTKAARYLRAHPQATARELAAHLGHANPSYARRIILESRGREPAARQQGRTEIAAQEDAPPTQGQSAGNGALAGIVDSFMSSVAEPEAVTAQQLADHLNHSSRSGAYKLLREWRMAHGLPVNPSRPRRVAKPAPRAERVPARREDRDRVAVPDVLGAILGQFGSVSGADLAGVFLLAPGLHDRGRPIIRDRSGQVYALDSPWGNGASQSRVTDTVP